MISNLKNKKFLALIVGSFISTIGDHFYNIALTLSLYVSTGDVGAIAMMWFIRAAMRIPVQFIAGIVADRYDRKKVILFTNLASVPFAFSFIWLRAEFAALIYVSIFMLQLLNDLETTAGMSMLPEIVEKEKLKDANSLFSMLNTTALFISPAIAGLVYKIYGESILFGVNAVSFLVAGICFSFIKYNFKPKDKSRAKFELFSFAREGYGEVIKNKNVLMIFVASFIPAILGRYYEIFKVVVADKTFDIGEAGIVYFSYAMAVGSFIAPIIISNIKNRVDSVKLYQGCVFMASVLFLVWGANKNAIVCIGIIALAGVVLSMLGILLNTLVQEEIDQNYLGRVFSFYKMIVITGAILGIVTAPLFLKYIGLFGSFLVVFVITVLVFISKNVVPRKI